MAKKTEAPDLAAQLAAAVAVAEDLQRELCTIDPEKYGGSGKFVEEKKVRGVSVKKRVDQVPAYVQAKIQAKLHA
jgi:hypothetical protein